jgi:hypothetical protein
MEFYRNRRVSVYDIDVLNWIRGRANRQTDRYEGVSKSFRTGRLKRELQMVQVSATRCSCIASLWVSLVSFAAIILRVASQRVIPKVSIHIFIDSVRKLLDTPSYIRYQRCKTRALRSVSTSLVKLNPIMYNDVVLKKFNVSARVIFSICLCLHLFLTMRVIAIFNRFTGRNWNLLIMVVRQWLLVKSAHARFICLWTQVIHQSTSRSSSFSFFLMPFSGVGISFYLWIP